MKIVVSRLLPYGGRDQELASKLGKLSRKTVLALQALDPLEALGGRLRTSGTRERLSHEMNERFVSSSQGQEL